MNAGKQQRAAIVSIASAAIAKVLHSNGKRIAAVPLLEDVASQCLVQGRKAVVPIAKVLRFGGER